MSHENPQVEGREMTLLAPHPSVCQECAVDHPPEMPHNAESLYYQVAFERANGRPPTWADALAHCSEEVRAAWVEILREHGVEVGEVPA